MSRPKILVLTSTLPRWKGDTEPAFVESLSLELADYFDVTVLAPRARGSARDEVLDRGNRSIRIRRFRYFIPGLESLANEGGIMVRIARNPLRAMLVPFFLIAQFFAVFGLHRRERFDAMHAHWLIPQGLVAATYSSLSGSAPPFLVTSHGTDLHGLHGSIMTRLKRWVLHKASHVTVVSEAMREKAVLLGCDESRITVRSMGVDLQSVFIPDGQERSGLAFVGRLVDVKGALVLIDALATLVEQHPDLRLTIVGDGPERAAVERKIARHDLVDNVVIMGRLPSAAVADILRSAAVFAMPSVETRSGAQEGFGLVTIEAMGCGCPVVASSLPGVRDAVLDGETGLFAAPGDAKDLADKIGRLLDDGELRCSLATRGRKFAMENFDWPVVGQRYADLLLDIIPAA